MARKKFDHFLIGKVSTDLKESFMTPFNLDPEMDMSDQLPFTGPQCQLPSQMNFLKLLFALANRKETVIFTWLQEKAGCHQIL